MPKANRDVKIDAYVVIIPELHLIEGTRSWIDLYHIDRRSTIKIYSSEKKAQSAASFSEWSNYDYDEGKWTTVPVNPEVHKIEIDLKLADKFLEDLHPEIHLGWACNGNRNLVDADTFTTKSKGDIITVHVSDDLPDIEYEVRDGSYLDDEAIKDSYGHPDVAAEFEPTKASKDKFNSDLEKLIKDAVRAEIADTVRREYQSEPLRVYQGGSSGSVPTDIDLQASNKRRLPAMYADAHDSIIESLSSDIVRTTRIPCAGGFEYDALEDYPEIKVVEDISIDNMDYIVLEGPRYALEDFIDDFFLAYDDPDDEDSYHNFKFFDDEKTLDDLEKELGRKLTDDEYKEWVYPKMLTFYDEYRELGMSDDDIRKEMKDAFYYDDLIQKVFDQKTKDTFVESTLNEERSDDIYDFIEDLYDLRKESIAAEGEYGLGNLVFKEFRNRGYLDNLKRLRRDAKSKELSLEGLEEAFKTRKPMSKEDFEKFKSEHPEYKFEKRDLGTVIFKDNNQIGTYLDTFGEIWLDESLMSDINMKDELKEAFGSEFSKSKRNISFKDFYDKYLDNAYKYKHDYMVMNEHGGSEYYVYKRDNGRLNHIITFIAPYNVMYYDDEDDLDKLANANDNYLEEYNQWNITEGKKKRSVDYRRLANIADNVVITEENLDEQALNNTCRINYDYPKDELIKELLN